MVRGVNVPRSFDYLAGSMLFILPIANHNICNVSAKAGDYTLKTALFAWRQTNGFHRFIFVWVESKCREKKQSCAPQSNYEKHTFTICTKKISKDLYSISRFITYVR